MTRGLSVKKPTAKKKIMQGTENESRHNKHDICKRTLWNPVVKARGPIANRKRNTSEITEDNTVTRNESTHTEEVIMPRMRNASDKDFVTKNEEKQTRISYILGPAIKIVRNWKRV